MSMICYWLTKIVTNSRGEEDSKVKIWHDGSWECKKNTWHGIVRNREDRTLFLSQKGYLEKVLKRFSIENSKPISVPLAGHFILSMTQCPQSKVERK